MDKTTLEAEGVVTYVEPATKGGSGAKYAEII
jgi:hypothetical protein